jgi:hypothetical protein
MCLKRPLKDYTGLCVSRILFSVKLNHKNENNNRIGIHDDDDKEIKREKTSRN